MVGSERTVATRCARFDVVEALDTARGTERHQVVASELMDDGKDVRER